MISISISLHNRLGWLLHLSASTLRSHHHRLLLPFDRLRLVRRSRRDHLRSSNSLKSNKRSSSPPNRRGQFLSRRGSETTGHLPPTTNDATMSLEIVRSRGVLSIAVRIPERVGTTVVADLKSDRRSGSTSGRQLVRKLVRKLNPLGLKPERCGPGDSSVGW
jgi:hypothetical protein